MSSRQITNGLLLIILGGLFLGHNLGIIPMIPWGALIRLWPVMIIVVGLQLIFPRGVLSLAAPAILLLAVFFTVQGVWWDSPFLGETSTAQISIPEQIERGLLLTRSVTVTELDIRAGNAQLELTSHPELSKITSSYHGNEGIYTWHGSKTGSNRHIFSFMNLPPSELLLTPQLEWVMDLEIPVLVGRVDLEGLRWRQLSLETGVTDTTITVPDIIAENRGIEVKNGVGRITLQLASGNNVRIIPQGGIDFLFNFKSKGFSQVADTYQSPHFDPNHPVLNIHLDTGLTVVNLEWL